MKIAYISPSFYPATRYGGPIFSTMHTCKELHSLGVELDIHTTNGNFDSKLDVPVGVKTKVDFLNGASVTYHNDNIISRLSIGLIFSLPSVISKADLVHCQSVFSISTPLSVIICKLLNKKIVVSPRGSLGSWCLGQGSRFKSVWLKALFKPFSNEIIWHVTAEDERVDVINVFPNTPDDNFIVIPNGISKSTADFIDKETLFKMYNLPYMEKFILSSGRVDKKKGFDYTIQAIAKLKNKSVGLVIMGQDYGEQSALTKLAQSLGVEHLIHFVGHIDDSIKWSFYKHADVFCLNSRHENFGNVYLESLSVGTPIIASVHTPWHFLEKENSGYCIENNPDLIASKMESILSSSAFMYEDCLKLASYFYWDKIALDFKEQYKRFIY